MPRIQIYDQQTQSVGPQEGRRATAQEFSGGLEGLTQLGQGVTAVGDELARRHEQSEISTLTRKFAEARASNTGVWKETLAKADPNDQTYAQSFLDKFNTEVDGIGEEIQTPGAKRFFDRQASALKSHFTETALAGQAELAGIKAKDDFIVGQNALTSSLLQDPSAYAQAKALSLEGLEAQVQSGAMPRAIAIQLARNSKMELAKSALQGWIKISPEEAKNQLASGKWDAEFDGDVKKQLEAHADMAIRGREMEQRQQQEAQKRLMEEAQQRTQTQMLSKIQQGGLSWKEIENSNLDFSQRYQMLNILDKHNSEGVKTDPKVALDLFQRIHAPPGDPRAIKSEDELNKYFGRGLDLPTLNQYRAEFQGKNTEEGKIESELKMQLFKVAEQRLSKANPMLGMKDADGEENLLRWQASFASAFKAGREAGKSPMELLNPESKDYLGNTISAFQKTSKQIMQGNARYLRSTPQNQTTAPSGSPTPEAPGSTPKPPQDKIKPGESMDAYLKRIGK